MKRLFGLAHWLKNLPLSLLVVMLCTSAFALLGNAGSVSAASYTYTSDGSYVVPATVSSIAVEIAGGGGQAGSGCDGGPDQPDGLPGAPSSVSYAGVVQATAYGGQGGLAVDGRCNSAPAGANGSAVSFGLTSATITTGGGAPGEPANGDSYQDGGNGGAGGKVAGILAVTPGQTVTFVVGAGYNGDGWVTITEIVPVTTITFTANATYTVPANVTSLSVEIAGGGGGAGSGCDGGPGQPDGLPGGSSNVTYAGAVQATAFGGAGGSAVDDRCNSEPPAADGSAQNHGLTSATITVGGGAPGEIADGDSYQNGGNGGAGGKIAGLLAVTPGQVVTIEVGAGYNGSGWVKIGAPIPVVPTTTYTSNTTYTVPANVTSVTFEIAAGGGGAGSGCDGGPDQPDGLPGADSSVTYAGVLQATALGGAGGLAVNNSCDSVPASADGSAVNFGLSSAIVTPGGGAPGEIADGDSYQNGGNGGAGGKISGTLAVTPGQVITIVVGAGYNGNGWVKVTENAPTFTYTTSGDYTVPANAKSITLEIGAGGGQAGSGCDGGPDQPNGLPGGSSSVTYAGVAKAIAHGGQGGLAVDGRCNSAADGAAGSAFNNGLTSATITTGGGAPGEIADGDSYQNGGNGGAGGKITGILAVTPGQVLNISVGAGFNGSGWVTGTVSY